MSAPAAMIPAGCYAQIGVARATVHRWRRQGLVPRYHHQVALAEYLGLTQEELCEACGWPILSPPRPPRPSET